MMFSLNIIAQDREYPFSVFAYTEPGAFEDGFNIGAGIDYQMNVVYFKAETFIFPDLNGITYKDLTATVGLNWHVGRWDIVRLYGGGKIGFIFRGGMTYPTAGPEFGIDVNITDSFYVGTGGSYMVRQDWMLWETNGEDYWRFNGYFKIGFRFKKSR